MRAAGTFLAVTLLGASALAQPPRLPIPIRGMTAEPTAAEREFSAGDALLQRGEFTAARARFEAARRLDPRDPRPVFYLGEVAFREARYAEAEPLFREAVRLRATMAEAHAELGATLRELGRRDDAVASLRAAVRLSPGLGEAHLTLGLCLEDAGDVDGALTAYRAAARALRDEPAPHVSLGLLLASRNPAAGSAEHTEALRALREGARRADRDAASLAAVGPALRRLGDGPGAVRALQRAHALTTSPSASLLAELAQAHYAAGQGPLALRRIDEAVRAAPRDPSVHYVRALLRGAAGDTAGAVASLRDVLRNAPPAELAARARARLTAMGQRPAP